MRTAPLDWTHDVPETQSADGGADVGLSSFEVPKLVVPLDILKKKTTSPRRIFRRRSPQKVEGEPELSLRWAGESARSYEVQYVII